MLCLLLLESLKMNQSSRQWASGMDCYRQGVAKPTACPKSHIGLGSFRVLIFPLPSIPLACLPYLLIKSGAVPLINCTVNNCKATAQEAEGVGSSCTETWNSSSIPWVLASGTLGLCINTWCQCPSPAQAPWAAVNVSKETGNRAGGAQIWVLHVAQRSPQVLLPDQESVDHSKVFVLPGWAGDSSKSPK